MIFRFHQNWKRATLTTLYIHRIYLSIGTNKRLQKLARGLCTVFTGTTSIKSTIHWSPMRLVLNVECCQSFHFLAFSFEALRSSSTWFIFMNNGLIAHFFCCWRNSFPLSFTHYHSNQNLRCLNMSPTDLPKMRVCNHLKS